MRVLSVICVLSLSPLISVAQAKQVLPGPFPLELVEVIDGDTFRARVDIWLGQSVTVRVRLKQTQARPGHPVLREEEELTREVAVIVHAQRDFLQKLILACKEPREGEREEEANHPR